MPKTSQELEKAKGKAKGRRRAQPGRLARPSEVSGAILATRNECKRSGRLPKERFSFHRLLAPPLARAERRAAASRDRRLNAWLCSAPGRAWTLPKFIKDYIYV